MLQFLVLGLIPGTKIQITFIDVLLVLFVISIFTSLYVEREKLVQLLRIGKSSESPSKVQSA
jgi:biopolymer transport protein ExbD